MVIIATPSYPTATNNICDYGFFTYLPILTIFLTTADVVN